MERPLSREALGRGCPHGQRASCVTALSLKLFVCEHGQRWLLTLAGEVGGRGSGQADGSLRRALEELGWSLALSPQLAPLCHCRAAHGLLAQLAENLFLQLGLMDIPQVGCGEGQGVPQPFTSPGPLCPNKPDSGSVHACDCSMPTARSAPGSHTLAGLHTQPWSPLELP